MCGIAGVVTREAWDGMRHRVARMNVVQSHRGPDGDGIWLNNEAHPTVALGHVRLAILDLSSAGAQPMVSDCGRHVISYNGEVYNYREIQRDLEALNIRFTTRCDTEVVLKALQTWGVDAFRRFNGMWAIAWLDVDAQQLVLCRDRFGIKPLYFFHDEPKGRLFFASELKALVNVAERKFQVNRAVAARYLQQFLLNAQDETFFEDIHNLPAGHYAVVNTAVGGTLTPSIHSYWRVGERPAFEGSVEAFTAHVRELFYDAVNLRLRSDVPVGVLLSGGLDSSSIAAAVRASVGTTDRLNLISAVSRNRAFSEAPHIDAVARHLGVEVQKVSIDLEPNELLDLMDTVIWQNDQPISGFSTAAHYLLMQRAKHLGVTVLLSGQGGDEVLGGYRKYVGFYLQDLTRRMRWLTAAQVFTDFARRRSILPQVTLRDARRYVLGSRFRSAGASTSFNGSAFIDLGLGSGDLTARQMQDLNRLTVPSLVHYEDRMSMAFAREIRLPFLDYRIVDALMTRPPDLKLRDGWTKWVFRKAMEPDLPASVAWRRDKQGFLNPQRRWLKHELVPRIRGLFAGTMLSSELGLIDQSALQALYERYIREDIVSGGTHDREVFGPLALEMWLRRYQPYLAQ
jgi:asparagine synthase (glutamine-hydrolysing)